MAREASPSKFGINFFREFLGGGTEENSNALTTDEEMLIFFISVAPNIWLLMTSLIYRLVFYGFKWYKISGVVFWLHSKFKVNSALSAFGLYVCIKKVWKGFWKKIILYPSCKQASPPQFLSRICDFILLSKVERNPLQRTSTKPQKSFPLFKISFDG